jgi:hypothetical protein
VVIVAPSPGADIAPTSLATPRAQHSPVNARLQQIFDSDPMDQTRRGWEMLWLIDSSGKVHEKRLPDFHPGRGRRESSQNGLVIAHHPSLPAHCMPCTHNHNRYGTASCYRQTCIRKKPRRFLKHNRRDAQLLHSTYGSADLARHSLIVPSGHHPRSARVQSPIAHHR